MSVAEPKDGGAARIDLHHLASDGVDRTQQRAETERVNVPELRTITPDEIQILAATGC